MMVVRQWFFGYATNALFFQAITPPNLVLVVCEECRPDPADL